MGASRALQNLTDLSAVPEQRKSVLNKRWRPGPAQPSINGPRRPTPQLEPIDFYAQAAVSGALGL